MTHSFFDLTPEEKGEIIQKATEHSNEEQKKVIDEYELSISGSEWLGGHYIHYGNWFKHFFRNYFHCAECGRVLTKRQIKRDKERAKRIGIK